MDLSPIDRRTAPAPLLELAERQHGLVAVDQVRARGLTRSAWRNLLATHRWEAVTPRVARRTGSPRTDLQRALAAVLDTGPRAYLSHGSGAALWGVPGFRLAPHHVIVTRGGRQVRTSVAVAHRPRHLPEPFAAEVRGVPVVRPALLLLQLAPRLHPERLQRLLDWFWSRRLLSGPSVRRELAPLMHRGRAGTAKLRELLDSLPEDYVPAASNLEARALGVLHDAGLGPFRRQVDVGGDERWTGRVDLLHTSLPLVVEVDSEAYHGSLSSTADDEARQAHIEAAGFEVARVDEVDVWHRPAAVVDAVRSGERRARTRRLRTEARSLHPTAPPTHPCQSGLRSGRRGDRSAAQFAGGAVVGCDLVVGAADVQPSSGLHLEVGCDLVARAADVQPSSGSGGGAGSGI